MTYKVIDSIIESFAQSGLKELVIGMEDADGTAAEEIAAEIEADGRYNWLKVEKINCNQLTPDGKSVGGIKLIRGRRKVRKSA